MRDPIAEVAQFGQELDTAWARHGRRPEALPELARAALEQARFHERIDPMDAVRWAFRSKELPAQYDPTANFGEPPVTLWRSEHLFMDMYFWLEPDIALHDHGFAGAFVNLVGQSMHCTYSFAESSAPASGVALGQLELSRVEALRPGSTSTIVNGRAFIHRVWHLSRPTITLVARTPRLPGAIQCRYFMPSLALYHPARDDKAGAERFVRQQQLMQYLVTLGHPDTYALCRDLILSSSPYEAFNHLESYIHATQKNADDWDECDALVADLANRHGEWANVFGIALHRAAALRAVHWDRLTGFPERLLVAMLQTYPTRQSVLEAAERFRSELPDAVSGSVTDWLRTAITSGGLTMKLSSEQITVALLLAEGASDDAILEHFSEEYALGDAECEALIELGQKLRAQPLIGRLLAGA